MKSIHKGTSIGICLLSFAAHSHAQNPLYKNEHFVLYPNRIEQGKFSAVATSSNSITSNYQSPANEFKSSAISFKFSINGKDNEMSPGVDHVYQYAGTNGMAETPLIVFGKQLKPGSSSAGYLPPNSKWKIRLDLRDMLNPFKQQGYYTLYNGEKLYKDDFKAVYVAGNTAPLMWDFNNLHTSPELQLKDPDGDGIYETTLLLNEFEEHPATATWNLSKDISAFPQYQSPYLITDAIYNMAIEEMIRAVEPDSTFRTGKEWAGVWTRDISYSIILSMAYLQPRVARNSLLRKVNSKRKIIQDTGTGGAWPISTDRMVWAIAAWELYKATGDRDWLEQAYLIIKNSLQDDYHNAYDEGTGLVKGESSFLDWREETYPRWMQPVDIFESFNLGTNAVHYEANRVAARMAKLLNKTNEALKFESAAVKIKSGINKYLWNPAQGFYGQYLYGRNYKMLSPRSEALGEALCILFDIATPAQQKQIVSRVPQTPFGITCIYPQIPDIPPYHNNAVWPFVQSYWLWATVKAGNETSVMGSIAAIYRPAALFLTNKENFVADNGDYLGTQINSSNMLWSLSGNISIVHKVFFGIRFNENSLSFHPYVPETMAGQRSLTNFHYRNAILDIKMEGFGNAIKSFSLDGKIQNTASIASTLSGRHDIRIILGNKKTEPAAINTIANYVSLPTPVVKQEGDKITWQPVEGADHYSVYANQQIKMTKETSWNIAPDRFGEYQVVAVDKNRVPSFASEPVMVANPASTLIVELEEIGGKAAHNYQGYTGSGFTEISTTVNTRLQIPVVIKEDGWYLAQFRYSNGNGPINTENKCAIRTLKADSKTLGAVVFPQRGTGEWSNWGLSNGYRVFMKKGNHQFILEYLPQNENMNGAVNAAMLDQLKLVKML